MQKNHLIQIDHILLNDSPPNNTRAYVKPSICDVLHFFFFFFFSTAHKFPFDVIPILNNNKLFNMFPLTRISTLFSPLYIYTATASAHRLIPHYFIPQGRIILDNNFPTGNLNLRTYPRNLS